MRRAWLVLMLAVSIAAAAAALALAQAQPTAQRERVQASAPTLRQLNRALAHADAFVEALYNPLGRGRAVTSEYLDVPLRVYLPRERRFLLAGDSGAVSATASGPTRESFQVVFRGTIALNVSVNWRAARDSFAVTVRPTSVTAEPIVVYLGSLRLGEATPSSSRALGIELPYRRREVLRSFRYTLRHGAQLAQNYYRYRHDNARFAATVTVLRAAGVPPNSDLTAPLWGRGRRFPDALTYSNDAYRDCGASPPRTALAYPYRSKACSARGLYLWLSHSDPLAPTATALHVLERHHDPDRAAPDGRLPIALPVGADPRARAPSPRSPRQTAAWLESIYRATGTAGVPRCLPASCEQGWASAVRTVDFGTLETMLGYHYGDTTSRTYADAVASRILREQVPPSGLLRTDRGSFLRPAYAGSFYLAWNRDDRARLSEALTTRISNDLSMPPEYTGIVISNSETTISTYAFLNAYRCARYRVGCDPTTDWGPAIAAPQAPQLTSSRGRHLAPGATAPDPNPSGRTHTLR